VIITLWNRLFDPNGTERELSWEGLVALLSERAEFQGGDQHPGWSPAWFDPCQRAKENARAVYAACFDFDKGESMATVLERVKPIARGLLHTSRKHREQGHGDRFRVVFPLSRSVSWFEFEELWKRVAPAVGNVDPAPKDASRFWYMPGTVTGAEWHAENWDGNDLDVDAWLRKPDPTVRAPIPVAVSRAERTNTEERARKYIAKMDAAVAGQKGHQATWDVALVLCRGFSLTEDRAYALLCEYNTRCVPPWSERELRHKIKGALAAEKVPRGFLLDRPDEWRTYRSTMPSMPPDDGYVTEPPADWHDRYSGEEVDSRPNDPDPAREPGADEGEPPPQQSAEERFGVVDIRALCFEVLSAVKSGRAARGHTTGHADIDALLCGLRPGMVSLVAASTSWGKSSWGIMVADENLRVGVPVLVLSVEDAQLTYGKRIVARRSGVNAIRIRNNECDEADTARIERVAMRAPSDPFYLNAIGKSVEWVAEAVTAICRERAIGVIVCDYVQRFKTRKNFGGDRRSQVSYAAETLADAGRNGGAHTVILSQLKRIEGREPTMDDVKESGDLENMADHVLLGHKMPTGDRYNEGEEKPMKRVIKIHKNKDGPTFTESWITMPFDLVTANFKTVTSESRTDDARDGAERALGSF
jgi:hypothetical protein